MSHKFCMNNFTNYKYIVKVYNLQNDSSCLEALLSYTSWKECDKLLKRYII